MKLLSTRFATLALMATSIATASILPATGQPTMTPENTPAKAAPFERSAAEMVGSLDLAWNLGNALDAPGDETAWGNPRITPQLLQTIAELGFDLVRIPVTWSPHIGDGPDYQIDPAWMDRVEEVVGYARDAGLYAIINVHHDGAHNFEEVVWLKLKDEQGNVTEENNRAVEQQFVAVWKQIAERFADAGEFLIFESMNEVGSDWNESNRPQLFPMINRLNQTFVDLVRESGGNNDRRYLLVPGYNTNIDHTLAGFELPKDPADDKLILSVHFYDPYFYALAAKLHTWGQDSPDGDEWGQEPHVINQFDKLHSTYVEQGVPVIMGEYGAVYQEGFEDYRRYYIEFVTKAASDRGILPVYWDNGGKKSNGQGFALIDRATGEVLRPAVFDAMRRAAKEPYPVNQIAPPKPAD